jgi:hypothetical protein
MELEKFIKTIRNEKIEEIIVKTKDCIYRWTEDKTYIAPVIYPPNLGTIDKTKKG